MTLKVLLDIYSSLDTLFSYKGTWSVSTIYTLGDIVLYNNHLYTAKTRINHTADSSTLLYHDNFTRADTIDGWGTSAEGITWITDEEDSGAGSLKITSNEGVSTSANSFDENITTYPIPSLTNRNIEVLWKFYLTGTISWFIFFYFLSGEFEAAPKAELDIYNDGSLQIGLNTPSVREEHLTFSNTEYPFSLSTDYMVRLHVYDNVYSARIWKASATEPTDWNITLTSDIDLSANRYIVFDSMSASGAGAVNIKDVKIYGLPSVSPDLMTSEWELVG